ncbi:MAG TPA: AarF/UbiB family protein [Pyrinomonadaceae bacterium]|nr:AarF/UbiB family protein [Pyrinomonadaceae bacterium]
MASSKLALWLREAALDIKRAILPLWEASKLGTAPLVRHIFGLPQKQNDYPKRIRLTLERLGLTYLKLGQYLAMRRDLLPEEVCQELSRLYEDVSPLPFQEVKAVIETELQGPLAQIFPLFDPKPLAAASVAQVHEARTNSNERVAVKIQRPGLKPIFAADTRNLRRVAALADAFGLSGTLSMSEVVEEFANWTSRELNFLIEGRTADRLRQNATAHEVVPFIYWELTTQKVLTMEFIDGLSLAQIIRLVAQGREDEILARLPNLDLTVGSHNLAHAAMHQLFVSGFFHGDPNPGNVIALDHNDIAFVDFGIFDELSKPRREILAGFVEALALGSLNQAFHYFSKLANRTDETDWKAFENESIDCMRRWYEASNKPTSTFKDRHLGKYFGELLGIMRRNHLRVEVDTLLFWRAMNALDYSALSMSRHFDLLHEMHIFFEQIRPSPIERMVNVLASKRFKPNVAELTTALPDYLHILMNRIVGEDSKWVIAQESLENNPSDLLATRCVSAALVGASLTVLGLGWNLDLTLLIVIVSLMASLFTLSLIMARPR